MVLMANNDVRQRVFEREFLPELGALYGFAYHLTYDEAAAEDLVQDTIERAIKAIDQYRQGTNAKAWLFKIMRNHFINCDRKKLRRPNMVDYEDVAAIIHGAVDIWAHLRWGVLSKEYDTGYEV